MQDGLFGNADLPVEAVVISSRASGFCASASPNKKITMAKIATYVKESWKELTTKVTWPTWDKLQSSAILVMVTTLILAVIIWLIDLIIRTIMTGIYSL